MSVDLHTLTGAYVLHATADTERAAFRRHLTRCSSCAQEVRELRETAVRLGATAAATPPPHLRYAVLDRIHGERQLRTSRRGGPALANRLVTAAAAVLLVVAVSLGVVLTTGRHDLEQARHRTEALTAILRTGDMHVAHADGITVVVSRTRDRAVLLADLPPAPDGHAYEVWTVDSGYHPAGVFAGGVTSTELTGVATADGVAVTVEPAGGSPRPTTAPVAETVIP